MHPKRHTKIYIPSIYYRVFIVIRKTTRALSILKLIINGRPIYSEYYDNSSTHLVGRAYVSYETVAHGVGLVKMSREGRHHLGKSGPRNARVRRDPVVHGRTLDVNVTKYRPAQAKNAKKGTIKNSKKNKERETDW